MTIEQSCLAMTISKSVWHVVIVNCRYPYFIMCVFFLLLLLFLREGGGGWMRVLLKNLVVAKVSIIFKP